LNKEKYLCIEKSGIILPANVNFESFNQLELEFFMRENVDNDETYVIAVTKYHAIIGAKLALKYNVKLFVDGVDYSFKPLEITILKEEQTARLLLQQAKEPVFFKAALDNLLALIVKDVPFKFTKNEAIDLVVKTTPDELMIKGVEAKQIALEFSLNYFNEDYENIKDLIQPRESEFVSKVKLSYSNELVEFIKSNPGIYILNGAMGSKKTQNIIKPLFDSFCLSGDKPLLIAPSIALTRHLISDERNYESLKKSQLTNVVGIASCVVSATTNQNFIKNYNPKSKVTLIEEFEECETNITNKDLMGDKTLKSCVKAMQEWIELLKKETVVIADATFSNFSVTQLSKLGRKIIVVGNSDITNSGDKTLALNVFEQHTLNIIDELNNDKTCAIFCGGGHRYNGRFRTIKKAIIENTKVIPMTVDSQFIKTNNGKKYLVDIDKSISENKCHIFSPVITSGVSITSDKANSINIFACKTVTPIQLAQSLGRFRKAKNINISFDHRSSLINTTKEHIFKAEISNEIIDITHEDILALKSNTFCEKVIERIQHNLSMRKNYVHVSLLISEILGFTITREALKNVQLNGNKLVSKARELNKSEYVREVENTVFNVKEYSLLKKFKEYLSAKELELLDIYELQRFYNIGKAKENIGKLISFDKNGKLRPRISNLAKLNHYFTNNPSSKELAYAKIFIEIFQILNLSSRNLEGQFTKYNIEELSSYLRNDVIEVNGEEKKICDLLISLGCSEKISKDYVDVGRLTQTLLKKLFFLKQKGKRTGTENSKGERPGEYFFLCPKRSAQVLYYLQEHMGFKLSDLDLVLEEGIEQLCPT
jgi:hypothetical protein